MAVIAIAPDWPEIFPASRAARERRRGVEALSLSGQRLGGTPVLAHSPLQRRHMLPTNGGHQALKLTRRVPGTGRFVRYAIGQRTGQALVSTLPATGRRCVRMTVVSRSTDG